MQCSNNLKQLALAAHTHHDAFGKLPGFGSGPDVAMNVAYGETRESTAGWYSPMVGLLPFFEQSARYSLIDSVSDGTVPDDGQNPAGTQTPARNPWSHYEGWLGTLSALLCPSNTNSPASESEWTASDYVFSMGDFYVEYPTHEGSDTGTSLSGNSRTFFPQNPWGEPVDTGLEQATDGTSNTIMLGERISVPYPYVLAAAAATTPYRKGATLTNADIPEFRAIKGGVLSYARGDSYQNPQVALTYKIGNAYGNYSGGSAAGAKPVRGTGTYFGYVDHGMRFCTIVPPNSPSVSYSDGMVFCDATMLPPTSYHTGGVNLAFGDGSVHFVSETIHVTFDTLESDVRDKRNGNLVSSAGAPVNGRTQKYGDYTGKSAFGVWGALGSTSGGEAVALP
jgi:prepilin-type processing-associated H-X9-DG protein